MDLIVALVRSLCNELIHGWTVFKAHEISRNILGKVIILSGGHTFEVGRVRL